MAEPDASERLDPFDPFRQVRRMPTDVLVLSAAMFAFSLGFQMTGRYMPQYLAVLGASSVAIGAYGSLGNLIGAVFPYPGGRLSDRIGSRSALTLFGVASTVGFLVWWGAGTVADSRVAVSVFGVELATTLGVIVVFLGLVLAQGWKSFGLGATFAVVKQSVPNDRLAAGFAATETFRRTAFLLGPLLAAGVLAVLAFEPGFRVILLVAAGFGAVATVVQHRLYDASNDSLGDSFAGVGRVLADLRALPDPLRPLLVGDTLVRFANGMVYVFFVRWVVDFRAVGATLPVVGRLSPEAYFGVLLAVEMAVALVTMYPVARLAERVGLKPVVAAGFTVYAVFPVVVVAAPGDALVYAAVFAFSGLRFAGLPAHKALIVGPAEENAGGRVTGSYYLVRNTVVIPSAALGGWVYGRDPVLAFSLATAVGLVGVAYFLLRGEEFAAYN